MPSKKKKYNARFPAGRIKKIMQTDEEVGKVAQAVPIIISRTLELFVESLLTKSAQITQARNAKTLTPSHMKQCILSESRFDFLKDLVKNIPDVTAQEDSDSPFTETTDCATPTETSAPSVKHRADTLASPSVVPPLSFTPNFYTEQGTSTATSSVIQYGSRAKTTDTPKIDFSVKSLVESSSSRSEEPKIHIDLTNIIRQSCSDVPPLIPLARTSLYGSQVNNDNLCIDEDYDN